LAGAGAPSAGGGGASVAAPLAGAAWSAGAAVAAHPVAHAVVQQDGAGRQQRGAGAQHV
jgi:hypothetical protein